MSSIFEATTEPMTVSTRDVTTGEVVTSDLPTTGETSFTSALQEHYFLI